VVEYVLLLIVAVSLAILITNAMVGRSDGNEGFVITKWKQIISAIAQDRADDVGP